MRHKLKKFSELLSFANVYENFDIGDAKLTGANGAAIDLKGKWNAVHFQNNNPITLELACGRGEYAVALGRMFPERNFIGVDIKGARIHQGATAALAEGLLNVAFLRTRIEVIDLFFAENEISEIWITFPDPFLRGSKANRRLTAPSFLDRYRQFLKPNAPIHLKTDSPDLYDFTLETLRNHALGGHGTEGSEVAFAERDIYANPLKISELSIKTYYEKANIARSTIKYIQFHL